MSRRLSLVLGPLSILLVLGLLYWSGRVARSDGSQSDAVAASTARAKKRTLRPLVFVENGATHDLGLLNPGDERRHEFIIKNKGSAPLTLTLGSTTCKCTLAELKNVSIPPGGSDVVALKWHAEQPQFRFRQGATINTNDPDKPFIELVGEGSVRVKLATLPETGYLDGVPCNESRSLNLLLYSQAFPEVTIRSIQSSSPAIKAELSKETPQTALPQETRFFRDVVVTLQPQAKAGHYESKIRIEYAARSPQAAEETGVCEVPVSFDVAGDITLHGRDVVGKELVFGLVPQAAGAVKQAYLHFRGDDAEGLRLTVVRATPDFLKVQIGEAQRLTPTLIRFPISVEVPPGVPAQPYMDDTVGEIAIATSHAERLLVRFSVSMIVVP